MAIHGRKQIRLIYFTSDTHFNHDKEFCWKIRGFNSVEEMNETIKNNWNNIVTEEDEVYLLGDVMLGDYQKGINIVSQLKGKIHIILGNHCTQNRIALYQTLPNVVEIVYSTLIKIGKQPTNIPKKSIGRNFLFSWQMIVFDKRHFPE